MNNQYYENLIKQCLNCKNPTCVLGCPVNNNIPKFIQLAKENKFQEAYDTIKLTSTLPSICSLVCPSEKQCMGHCVKNKISNPVKINEIEQYITLNAKECSMEIKTNGHKVAIIGSGPAGLACAEKLALLGYSVDIYDKYDIPGGILTYGIPDFVLNKKIVNDKINYLKSLNINFIMNKALNKDIFLEDLSNQYDAIFLAFGTSVEKKMNIENESLKGIMGANEFLNKAFKNEALDVDINPSSKIIVVGGGNTAIDAARVAKRKYNCNVTIVYRRSQLEMPCRSVEYTNAIKDNISFNFLTNPVKFIGNEVLKQIEVVKMELVKVDNDRARPVVIENSNYKIDSDLVILALSTDIDKSLTNNLKTNKWGLIEVNENMQTSLENIFAGGDCVRGPSLVVSAMKDGINAAINIDKYIKKNSSN